MVEFEKSLFDTAAFLMSAGLGRKIVQMEPKQTFFSQGDPADSVFYLQTGRAKITVVSKAAKKPPLRFSPKATSWVKARYRRRLGCACPRPPRLPPAQR
jgi:hypothetical protein